MKFAIKHSQPAHYLQKDSWSWINELNESTVYTGAEVAAKFRADLEEFAGMASGILSIVVVREVRAYEEMPE